ncbi:MAG: hypothetical protein ABEJ23_07415 [Haloarculaceae archaeon]
MVASQRSDPETCTYCGERVAGERAYRRHLYDAHEPSELGAIDRRRYDSYRPEPNAVVQASGEVVSGLGSLRYPVERETMARYALYGFLTSLFLAAALGVGL